MLQKKISILTGDCTGRLKEIEINESLQFKITLHSTEVKESIDRIYHLVGSNYICITVSGLVIAADLEQKTTKLIYKPQDSLKKLLQSDVHQNEVSGEWYLFYSSTNRIVTVLEISSDFSSCTEFSQIQLFSSDVENVQNEIQFVKKVGFWEFCCGCAGEEMLMFKWEPKEKTSTVYFTSENIPESVVTGVLKDPGYLDCCMADGTLWTSCRNGQIRAFSLLQNTPIHASKPFAKPYPLCCISSYDDSLLVGDTHGNSYIIVHSTELIQSKRAPSLRRFKTTTYGACLSIYAESGLFFIASFIYMIKLFE